MKQRTASALKLGAGAVALAASVWVTAPCVDGPASDSRNPRPQTTMQTNAEESHVVPAGLGVHMEIGKGRLKLSCLNIEQGISSKAVPLREGILANVNGILFKGLDDKGVDITVAGETQRVYLSFASRCTVSVDGKAVAEVYNRGAPDENIWVYPK